MAQTGYSKTIVNVMLGWLKGLASWVLRLFNLSGGISPLRFLANNWIQLLVLLLVVCMAADLLVWLIRWRPHWVWFRKKRVIINDRNFFAEENEYRDEDDGRARLKEEVRAARESKSRRNWRDNDFVVAGEARRKREERRRREAARRRREAEEAARESAQSAEAASGEPKDVFRDGLFNVNAKQRFSDRYEDEVFSVSNLPRPEGDGADAQRGRRPKKAGESASRGGKARPTMERGERRTRANANKR